RWVVCASGPSILGTDFAHLRRFRRWNVLAVNNTWQLVPWAAAMYAGDRQWWDRYGATCTFAGQRWTRDKDAALWHRLHRVEAGEGEGLCTCGGVHLGGNSG